MNNSKEVQIAKKIIEEIHINNFKMTCKEVDTLLAQIDSITWHGKDFFIASTDSVTCLYSLNYLAPHSGLKWQLVWSNG